ncbi:MAG: tetratricopeptide repeat protein [Myxococcota bacterium]|nr:tetratricopeptide repeat protein [Myxococcota bacterium]
MSPLLLLASALAGRPHWEPPSGLIEAYNVSITAINDDRIEEALGLIQPILDEDPDCGRCQSTQAIALLRAGRPREAQSILEPLSLLHDRPEVHTLRAVAAAALGEHERARDAAMRAVNQDPSSRPALRVLLSELLHLSEHVYAQRVLQLAHQHLDQPEAACLGVAYALSIDNLPGARGAMSQCLYASDPRLILEHQLLLARSEGDLSALSRYAEALGLVALKAKADAASSLQSGAIEAAGALLDGVLEENPDDADALLLRARCRQAEGKTNGALLDLDHLKSLTDAPHLLPDGSLRQLHSPTDLRAEAGALRVMLLIDEGRLADARIILQQQEESPITAAASIRLHLAVDGAAAAAAELERAVQEWPDAPCLVAVALQISALQPPSPRLIRWIQGLQESDPAWHMAALQHRQGEHRACLALLAPLSEPRALTLSHRCAAGAGDLPEAERLWSALTEALATPDIDATMRHAWLLGQAGDPGRALSLLEGVSADGEQGTTLRSLTVSLSVDAGTLTSALEITSQGTITPEHRAHLARALYESGRPQQGIREMSMACTELTGSPRRDCQAALSQMKAAP